METAAFRPAAVRLLVACTWHMGRGPLLVRQIPGLHVVGPLYVEDPAQRLADLAVDHFVEGLAHEVEQDRQMPVFELLVAVRQKLEDIAHIPDDSLVGGQ